MDRDQKILAEEDTEVREADLAFAPQLLEDGKDVGIVFVDLRALRRVPHVFDLEFVEAVPGGNLVEFR